MQRVLLVGKGSFIAKNFVERYGAACAVRAVSYIESEFLDLSDYRCVVNMAYRPSYFIEPCSEETDFCLRIARRVAAGSSHFVMMSSRKVYGTNTPFPVSETAALNATDTYGMNNIFTESRVLELLGDRCTILRPANVFGWEPGRHTFFGLAISRLLEHQRLVFPFSAFTPRDFLPVQHFSRILAAIVELCPAGIFNVGSGLALPIGQICLWIMEGYGRGEVVITRPQQFDRFRLDISKLEAVIGPQPDLTLMIYESSVAVGRAMRDLEARRLSSGELILSRPS
jgi:nucleoside-diphosphate-sugar epimerase